jgi:recombination protein RecT
MSENKLLVIHNNLEKLLDAKREAMPQGFNKTRFLQNCMTVLMDTKDIDKCDAVEVSRVLLKGAFLGLDFFNKECYVVIYQGKPSFQTDYKGEKKLAMKYSVRSVKDIYAKVVRQGDEFVEEVIHGKPSITFKPQPFNDGEILGAFAVAMFDDGSMIYETMTVKDIEGIKTNFSRKSRETGQYSKAWSLEETKPEMYKKTVMRRLCKNIELDFDTIEQAQAFEDSSDMDFSKDPKPAQQSPLNVVEADYTDVTEADDDPNQGKLL